MRPPLKVFLTMDVELWPSRWGEHRSRLSEAYRRYIIGETPDGDYGLGFQLELAREHDLQIVCFVETLFSCECGLEPLKDVVALVREYGQEIQLHVHPEWVRNSAEPIFDTGGRYLLSEFSELEQRILIEQGLKQLRECGVDTVNTFRAGSFASNSDTLKAIQCNGLQLDSSFKAGLLPWSEQRITLQQPVQVQGVREYPLTRFVDWPGHYRQLQVGACSFPEFQRVISDAWARDWEAVVILTHSAELLTQTRTKVDKIVRARFERLCRWLADNRDRYQTTWFATEEAGGPECGPREEIYSKWWQTLGRIAEQISRRIM